MDIVYLYCMTYGIIYIKHVQVTTMIDSRFNITKIKIYDKS